MKNVVYLLGAGFSAPLGLPVMSNFLMLSKDMYFSNMEKYAHHAEVLATIERMSKCKNYYSSNLFNIEEILSILEMEDSLSANSSREKMVRYISDVISHYTPAMPPKTESVAAAWYRNRFSVYHQYAYFVGNIMNVNIEYDVTSAYNQNTVHASAKRSKSRDTCYSVISLNYDMLLEHLWDAIKGDGSNVEFGLKNDAQTVTLAKLHGSVNEEIMVAPTWNKSLNANIRDVWKAAYTALQSANEIRVIGYSLPLSDAYVKYLLKSAVLKSEHLRHIDIILKGEDVDAQNRYREFITFPNTRISVSGVETYMQGPNTNSHTIGTAIQCSFLEEQHDNFFKRTGRSLHT